MTDPNLDQQNYRLQVEHAEALARLASHLNAETSLEQIFQIACDEIASVLGVGIAFIAAYDEASDSYQLAKLITPEDVSFSFPDHLFLDPVFKKMVLTSGKPLFFSDIRLLRNTEGLIHQPDQKVHALFATGLFHEARKIGILGVLAWDIERRFSQDEVTLFQTFADQIAIAIDHAHLLLAIQRQAQRLVLINEITQQALAGSSLKEIMSLLAARVVEMLAAEGCYINLWDNERQVLTPYTANGPESSTFMETMPLPGDQGQHLSLEVLTSGHAVFIDDSGDSFLGDKLPAEHSKNHTTLALPLKVNQKNLGVVLIEFCKPHPYFSKEDISRWEEIASQISLAIVNILSVEKEKQRRKEAELLQQATFAITSSLNLQEVLDHILTALNQVVPFDGAAISLLEGDSLRIVALGGLLQHTRRIGDKIGKLDGLFSILATSNSVVVLKDAQTHPKYVQWSEGGKDPIHGWMGVPLIAHDHPMGYLTLNCQDRDVYSADHANLARAFANQAVVAIDNARLFEKVRNGRERLQGLSRKLVNLQEAERRLIAHELHDKIGQDLTGLQFVLLLGKEGSEADRVRAFGEAQDLVSNLMSQVRELSLNLHPAMLDDLGLLPALRGHFERYQQQTGIQIHFDTKNVDRRFPAEIELAAFRLVQESLTNVARHADVKEAAVITSADTLSLFILIEDHGQGFDMDLLKDSERSFGVTGMRERTYQVGGKFEFFSKPGQGTRIVAIFPIGNKLERRGNDRQSFVS
jgi:signal transduction histidine kinase